MCEDNKPQKTRRFFGDGETFGDGGAWVYLGDTLSELAASIQQLDERHLDDSEGFEIRIRMMTDAEVEALPDM